MSLMMTTVMMLDGDGISIVPADVDAIAIHDGNFCHGFICATITTVPVPAADIDAVDGIAVTGCRRRHHRQLIFFIMSRPNILVCVPDVDDTIILREAQLCQSGEEEKQTHGRFDSRSIIAECVTDLRLRRRRTWYCMYCTYCTMCVL